MGNSRSNNAGIFESNSDVFDQFRVRKSKVVLIYVSSVLMFYLWYQAIFNISYADELWAYDSLEDFLIGFAVNFIPILLIFLFCTFIVFKIRWKRHKRYRLAFDFALSFLGPVTVNMLFISVSLIMGKEAEIRWPLVIVLDIMILTIVEAAWFMINYQHVQRKYEEKRLLASRLEYNVLRTQVNPHFLFNSLNILHSLSHLDIPKTQDFILMLSKMYRYIMVRRDNMSVKLSDELTFLASYIQVLQFFYYDCFDVEFEGYEHIQGQEMVPFSLQLLIENVTKHNIINQETPMIVKVRIEPDFIEVSNPMHPKADVNPVDSTGIGLDYMNKLYKFNGKEVEYSNTGDTFMVRVPFLSTPATQT